MLPYSLDAWFSTIARMNTELAVFVVIALLLGLFLLAVTWWPALADHKEPVAIDRRAGLSLAAAWLAAGALFHGTYLEPMFFAATWLMALFVIQGVLLTALALVRPLPAATAVTPATWAGRLLMLHALAAMPLLDLLLGPGWPAFRVIGLAPEPTVVLTCGWLLTRQPDRRVVLVAILPAAAGAWIAYQALALGWPVDWLVPLAGAAAIGVPVAGLVTATRSDRGKPDQP